jgi:hypothetical protein
MIDFWAALGLAVVDEPFLAKVLKARKDPKALTKVVNRDYNFHLSRFEVAEFADFLGHKKVIESMRAMHEFWNPRICEVSLTFDPDYVHVKPSPEMIKALSKSNGRQVQDANLRRFLKSWDKGHKGAEHLRAVGSTG